MVSFRGESGDLCSDDAEGSTTGTDEAHRAPQTCAVNFMFIPKHHAQRPDAKEKKRQPVRPPSPPTLVPTPKGIRELRSRSSPPVPKDRDKKGFTLGQRGYRSSTRLENNLWLL
jgi:hypothetical protein